MSLLSRPEAFQQALGAWYVTAQRPLPWRTDPSLYKTVVSELMAQQTQIKTMLPYFDRWLKRFPDFQALAEATSEDVLKHWEGLGYYRRARNLHAAAKAITRDHHGRFPEKFEQIRALPGIGPYTAGAVASFAYNEPQAIVDANVARVFSRLFDFQERIDTTAGNKQIWQWAQELLPDKKLF